jgi:hypothetical protein
MATDMSSMVNVMQQQNQVLTALLGAFQAGFVVKSTPSAIYTFAALPVTAAAWTSAVCSNGLKPGESSGSGTGVPIFFNPGTSTWFSYCSGAVVTS